jgi:hypothetical protein
MNSKSWNSKLLIIPTVLLILFLLFIPNNTTTIKTVYHTKTDTIHDTLTFVKDKPQIKVIETLKIDTVTNSKGDTIKLITEEKKYLDTLLCDKDTAIFTATVSGVNAKLDSVKIKLLKDSYIHTNTIEITKCIKDKKRLHFSPQIGLGYGVFNKKIDAYIGFGISYDL